MGFPIEKASPSRVICDAKLYLHAQGSNNLTLLE